MSEIGLDERRLSTCKLCSLHPSQLCSKVPRELTGSGAAGIVVGTILQAASINYGMMLFARIFNGIFNGMLTSTVPTYQSECAKPHQRGQLLLFSGSLITFVRYPPFITTTFRQAGTDQAMYHVY
jgi:hypothetical protein